MDIRPPRLSYKGMEKTVSPVIQENQLLKEDVTILEKDTAWFVQNDPVPLMGILVHQYESGYQSSQTVGLSNGVASRCLYQRRQHEPRERSKLNAVFRQNSIDPVR